MTLTGTAAIEYAGLDGLAKSLSAESALLAIIDRPEAESALDLPTFGGAFAGDGGDGYEVLSWDADRVLMARWTPEGYTPRHISLVIHPRADWSNSTTVAEYYV